MSSSSSGPDRRGVPDVSVIIPAYNTAAYIATAVASVLAQTYTSHETIVVNDGSSDPEAMERALAPYRDRIVYIVQENGGISAARNAGIAAARGRYIALLDSDDAWEPDYLASQVAVLEAEPSVAGVYPDALIVGDHPHAGRRFSEVCPTRGEPTFRRVLTQECHVFISVLMRRDALARAGLFDPELRSVEDFDLWLRLLARGERLVANPRVLVRFLKRRNSMSADPVWMAQNVLKVLDKIERTLPLSSEDRRVLELQRNYFAAQLELAQGKRAFFRQDVDGALNHIERSNVLWRRRKLQLVCALIRRFPGVLLRVYRLRDRLVVGADTSF
jgi:glycosyltransferase involved in cell wall biosynthesis